MTNNKSTNRDLVDRAGSDADFRVMVQKSPNGILVIQDDKIVFANQSAAEIFGCEIEDLLNQELKTLEDLMHPDDADRIREYRQKRLTGEEVEERYEIRSKRKDGSYVWREVLARRIEFNGRPAILSSFSDITERYEMLSAFRESERRYRRLFESIQDIYYEVSLEGTILEVSPSVEKIALYKREELLGTQLSDLYAEPERRAELLAHLQRHGEVADYEIELRDKDGRIVPCSITAGIVQEEGKEPAIIGSVRVIAERKRSEKLRRELDQQLQQAQKMKSLNVMAGSIAHNFNNLLMTVLGNLEMGLGEMQEGSGARFCIEEAELAARRAAELSSQMLIYAGQGQETKRPCKINELLQRMSGMLEINVSKKALMETVFSGSDPMTNCDTAQIRQVVMNIVSNAAEAVGDSPGIIRITTGMNHYTRAELSRTVLGVNLPEGEYVWIEVQDTGPGMDDETLAHIFDPFFTTKFTGRGLGLATVLGIIRGHKGTIIVNSQENKGTRFRILLPALSEADIASEKDEDDLQNWKGSGLVLVVDDEEEVCRLCCRMLEKAGFDVLTARDGYDALTLFRRRKDEIICVVLDLVMPRMDGEEALREIRNIRPDVPIMLSSGCNIDEIKMRFPSQELNAIVHKPYQYMEMMREMKRMLELSQARKKSGE
ncbi:MAG: PAS domain S-box protein [Candidatus Sumerlaeia bacterium]